MCFFLNENESLTKFLQIWRNFDGMNENQWFLLCLRGYHVGKIWERKKLLTWICMKSQLIVQEFHQTSAGNNLRVGVVENGSIHAHMFSTHAFSSGWHGYYLKNFDFISFLFYAVDRKKEIVCNEEKPVIKYCAN